MKCPKCGSDDIKTETPKNLGSEIEFCGDCGCVLSGHIRLNASYHASPDEGMCEITMKDSFQVDWMITSRGAGVIPESYRTVGVIGNDVYLNENLFGGMDNLIGISDNPPDRFLTDGDSSYILIDWVIERVPNLAPSLEEMKQSILEARQIH